MSIKKLFGPYDENNSFLSDANEKDLFHPAESAKNVDEILKRQNEYSPPVDYSDPSKFARYGSARLYYSGAVGRILDYYPYDGSDAEQNEFYNKSMGIERHIFDNLWPRTHGYANFNSSSYIDFKGGPHTIGSLTTAGLFKDDDTSKRSFANVYDENIYESAGLPNTYGTGSRQSNLRANFDSGVTVEFWLKSKDIAENSNSVIFDMWNNNASGTVDMGRMTIEILSASSASPFRFTVQSGSMTSGMPGSGTLFQQSIGQNILSTALDDWKHYAFVFHNSGSDFVTKLYVNGYENHTVINSNLAIGELPPKDMVGRIGSLVTVPFRSDAAASTRTANTHTLTGSIDEFRYWKEARSSADIGKNWFKQVRGGTNSDISNTTLGVYYKFNEGVANSTALDNNVLDYSGRLSNGTWTGTASRSLSSAMIESSASTIEYKDPIIYITHPDVVELKNGLNNTGSIHDYNNNTNFFSYMPSWIMAEHEDHGNENPEIISHILGSYFDKIYNLIEALPTFKGIQNTSASFTPISFAKHLPESLGLDTPNLFIESNVVNSFLNASDKFRFSGDLTQTKNLIYQNLYNNMSSIYKSKGTERAVKNILRCFYLDDSVIKFKTYVDNSVYDLDTNSVQVLKNRNMLLFNAAKNIGSVCFLRQDPDDTSNSRGFISGSGTSLKLESGFGMTMEANIRFPRFYEGIDPIDRTSTKRSSLFGIYSASVDRATDFKWMFEDGGADFQVYANRVLDNPKSVYFSLTSSLLPSYELTSSVFTDVYSNSDWNISVRLKPSTYPYATFVAGNLSNYTYDLIFEGINTNLGTVSDTFVITASVAKDVGDRMVSSAKRPYVGANRTNFTGTLNYRSDVLVSAVKYWAKYLDTDTLRQHALDIDNVGISGSFRNLAPYVSSSNMPHEMLNKDTLAMYWNFSDLTSSDSNGRFFTQDMSSGSAADGAKNGWLGGVGGFLHKGYGFGFDENSTSIKSKQQVNTFKFIDPEQATSSDMVKVLTNDDEVYGFASTVPNFYNTLEKSMYDAISEEMLTFFAGAIDFHNLIGEPVNRYRESYKAMGHLRRQFFKRVNQTKEVEKYVEYYKWFDDAISKIVSQMVPAASKFADNTMNVVESHVLERNKYKTMFPTIEFKQEDPISPMLGIRERLYQWSHNHHPLNNQTTTNPDWWRDRAERDVNMSPVSAGDSDLDGSRDIYRETIANDNNQKKERKKDIVTGHSYLRTPYIKRKLSLPYKFDAIVESDYLTTYSPMKTIKGGVNFRHAKRIDYAYNALRPAGRINQVSGNFIPENVLFAQFLNRDGTLKDLIRETRYKRGLVYGPEPHANDQLYRNRPSEKVLLNVRVQHGRDVDGYSTIDALSAFPFNIVSSSVTTGYNRLVVQRVTGNIEITNLHHDVYGEDMEKPMQTIFTEHVVGGHQSRHVPINIGNDNETNRPEAWKIQLGYPTGEACAPHGTNTEMFGSGVLGMVGPDYPLPNAGYETGKLPYPATASLKAPWYRGMMIKQPFNIKNIQLRAGPSGTFPTRLGNYRNTYEFIQTVGAWSNPIGFRDGPPNFTVTGSVGETVVLNHHSNSNKATSIRTIRDIKRIADGRPGAADYSTAYLTGAKNKSVFIQRFSHGGGIEVDTKGYQDFRSTEFSVYNAIPYRNLTVRTPFQNPTSISNVLVNGDTTNIQISDIHGLDYGLTAHLARASARFGRDSLYYPSDSRRLAYDLTKPFIGFGDKKIYRSGDKVMGWWRLDNNFYTLAVSGTAVDSSGNNRDGTFNSGSLFRPFFSGNLGPSDWIQTGSAAFNNFTQSNGVNTTEIDIGSSIMWNGLIGNSPASGSTQKMTFAAWIYPIAAGSSGFSRIFSMGKTIDIFTNHVGYVGFMTNWNTTGSETQVVWFNTHAVNYNVWSHVAVTYDATSNLNNPKCYINGSEVSFVGPKVNGGDSIANADMTDWYGAGQSVTHGFPRCLIGNLAHPTLKNEYAFQGNIADTAIWNKVLSSEEIAAIYNASKYEEQRGPGYSDNLNVVQELPSFHKIHRNSGASIGIKSETHDISTIFQHRGNENTKALYFFTPETHCSMLLNADGREENNTAARFLSASRPAGFTYSGWVRCAETSARQNVGHQYFFGVGKDAAQSEPFIEISKVSASLSVQISTRTNVTYSAGSPTRAVWKVNTANQNPTDQVKALNEGEWIHLVVSVPVSSSYPYTGPAAPSIYFNGVAQPVEEDTSPAAYWDRKVENSQAGTDILGLGGNMVRQGSASFAFGRDPTKGGNNLASFGYSGAMDQISIWTTALNSTEVTELYNTGIPCDITSSTAYADNTANLFAWYKLGEASRPSTSQNQQTANTDKVASSRTTSFASASNAIFNVIADENHLFPVSVNQNQYLGIALTTPVGQTQNSLNAGVFPTPKTGCPPLVLGQSASVRYVYEPRAENDNFFVQHMIPRNDRQYAWITGAIEDQDPRNVRFSGYMPIFGPQQGMYANTTESVTVYEPYFGFLSESEFGYTRDTNTSLFRRPDFALLGAIKYSSNAFSDDFKGQDFAGLNTIIYEPIEQSASMVNTLGWATAVHSVPKPEGNPGELVKSASMGTPVFRTIDRTTAPGDQYRNVRFFEPPDEGYGGFWSYVRGGVSASFPGEANAADGQLQGYLFNTLMLKRNGPYGYSTFAMARKNRQHPVLRMERSSSTISVYNRAKGQIEKYALKPVSMRARPTLVNYTPYDPLEECGNSANPQSANPSITLKVTDINEKIMFNSIGLNNLTKINPKEIVTPLDHILLMTSKHRDFGLNWMSYTEKVYPSARNEFVSHSQKRTGYDMQMWRDERRLRNELGNATDPSVGRNAAAQFLASGRTDYLSRSCWPLDAPANFLVRSGSIVGSNTVVGLHTASQRPSPFKGAGVNRNYLRAGPFNHAGGVSADSTVASAVYPNVQIAISHAAGELQNCQGHAHFAHDATRGGRGSKYDGQFSFLNVGALYARKHMLSPFLSVGNPTGMEIKTTGTLGVTGIGTSLYRGAANLGMLLTQSVFVNGGEALWEAGEQAGILRKSGKAFTFISKPSKPWYDNYEDFRLDLRYIAKDYVVIPEFRISDNIVEYNKFDIDDNDKFDTFTLPGTGITSVTGAFFEQYMDSSKMQFFRQQGLKTNLTAKEIKISVKAVKKWNPYKGFYPAQRTIDLVRQFSSSYNNSIQTKRTKGKHDGTDWLPAGALFGNARPVYQPLFMPGILFNSIKSGMAVDWPAIFGSLYKGNAKDYARISNFDEYAGMESAVDLHTYMIHCTASVLEPAQSNAPWESGTPFWDTRLPFETILAPEGSMLGEDFADLEPHPSATVDFSASLVSNNNDSFYTLMARNFFGETANFFLRGRTYTELVSGRVDDNIITFKSGTVYGARLRLKRSLGTFQSIQDINTTGGAGDTGDNEQGTTPIAGATRRYYSFDRDAWGSTYPNGAYSPLGGRFFDTRIQAFVSGAGYELPQDPIHPYIAQKFTGSLGANNVAQNGDITRESYTMYSRPSAFGPPVSGRVLTNAHRAASASMYGIKDSLEGYNWAYTPPYYHGEAWMDLVFRPNKTQYTLEEVLEEVEHQCWRVDPGPVISKDGHGHTGTPAYISSSHREQCIYDGRNVNASAMQVSASLNVFGIRKESFLETDQFGNPNAKRNETKATRWVIKPKFETPMLNFNSRYRPASHIGALSEGSVPLFASASVPHGMWHQFGYLEPDKNRGIFMEMSDIPKNWLKYHYMVRQTSSLYNGNDVDANGANIHSDMKSLADVFQFKKTPVRLGEIARYKVIREAVVGIPYRNVLVGNASQANVQSNRTRKEFFGIEPFRVAAALAANSQTDTGQSLDVAGESIRRLVRKMKKYILPPQFDFLRNPAAPPIAMYIFDFHYKLDKDDLSYIWQNIAPRNYKKVSFQESSIAHELNNTELLDAQELLDKDVQWMFFKVKQKATGDYFSHVATQVGAQQKTANTLEDIASKSLQYNLDFSENVLDDTDGNGVIRENTYELQYNWPYDYLSIVEGVKVEIEVLYDDKVVKTTNLIMEEIDEKQSKPYEKDNEELPDPKLIAKQISVGITPQIAVNDALDRLNLNESGEDISTNPEPKDPIKQPTGVKFSMPSFSTGLFGDSFNKSGGSNQGGGNQGGKK